MNSIVLSAYWKIAVKSITKGEHVIKYGAVIEKAIRNTKVGNHVHVHNIGSIREQKRITAR